MRTAIAIQTDLKTAADVFTNLVKTLTLELVQVQLSASVNSAFAAPKAIAPLKVSKPRKSKPKAPTAKPAPKAKKRAKKKAKGGEIERMKKLRQANANKAYGIRQKGENAKKADLAWLVRYENDVAHNKAVKANKGKK